MEAIDPNSSVERSINYYFVAGVILILIGGVYLADQFFHTGWLPWIILPVIALLFLIGGGRLHKIGLIIPGGLLGGVGIGLYFMFYRLPQAGLAERSGVFLLAFAGGWLLITLLSALFTRRPAWWAAIPAAALAFVGACLVFTDLRLVDFVLYLVTGLGIILLVTGGVTRLFGLIIPGCLLVGIGPGIYLAWGTSNEPNGLTQTGVMLVCFALGWGLITLFSRVVTVKFVWWPLIPGGILAMVGWGLYIGGNPDNALSFIGNTGSVGLIIFGLYLLLLRKGIHR